MKSPLAVPNVSRYHGAMHVSTCVSIIPHPNRAKKRERLRFMTLRASARRQQQRMIHHAQAMFRKRERCRETPKTIRRRGHSSICPHKESALFHVAMAASHQDSAIGRTAHFGGLPQLSTLPLTAPHVVRRVSIVSLQDTSQASEQVPP